MLVRNQAEDRQMQPGHNARPVIDGHAAAHLEHGVRRAGHGRHVPPDHEQVVAVMGHTARRRAGIDPNVLDHPHAARAAPAGEDRHQRQTIAFRKTSEAILHRHGHGFQTGNRVRLIDDHHRIRRALPPSRRRVRQQAKIGGRQRPGKPRELRQRPGGRDRDVQRFSIRRHPASAHPHLAGREGGQLVQDDEVGQIARRNPAQIVGAHVAGRADGRRGQGLDRGQPALHRQPDHAGEMALAQQVGLDIIGDQHNPVPIRQRVHAGHVLGGERLGLQHHGHALRELLEDFGREGQGVIGLHPVRQILRQLHPGQGRDVAFDADSHPASGRHQGRQAR